MILEQEVLILVTVTYDFYKDSYGGVLNENIFNKREKYQQNKNIKHPY